MFRIRSLYAVVALIAMMSSVVVAQEQTREEIHRSLTVPEVKGTFLKRDIMYAVQDENQPHFSYALDLDTRVENDQGGTSTIVALTNMENLPPEILVNLKSGKTTLTFKDIIISDDAIAITPRMDVSAENPDNVFQDGFLTGSRRLQTADIRTVLVVRVETTDNSNETTANAAELSDAFFRTDGLSLKSQFEACSFGQQIFDPYLNASLPADGVYTATLDTSDRTTENLVNLIELDLENTFGKPLPFDLAICLPKGPMGNTLAFADQGGSMSVYNDINCLYPSIQMHEFGHNLGLDHAGHMYNDTAYFDYGDQSGYMGSSYLKQDEPRMCFNGANSWALNWYSTGNEQDTFKPLETPSWDGFLVGIAEYDLVQGIDDDDYVLVKIEGDIGETAVAPTPSPTPGPTPAPTPVPAGQCRNRYQSCTLTPDTCCNGCACILFAGSYMCDGTCLTSWGSRHLTGAGTYNNSVVSLGGATDPLDYYLAFNRKVGINNETQEGGDQVLITSRGVGDDLPTRLHAILSTGESFSIGDFGGTGTNVYISVLDINTTTIPARANVEITSDLSFPTASPSPSLSPSDLPSEMPSFSPTVFECVNHADCNEDGIMLACSNTTKYCNGNTCAPVQAACDCDRFPVCDAGETEASCPSDCSTNSTLATTLAGGNGQAGNMWDIVTKKNIQVLSFDIHTSNDLFVKLFIYTKVGSYVGFETDSSNWTLIDTITDVRGEGLGDLSPARRLATPLIIPAGQRQAFYLTLDEATLKYTNGNETGAVFTENDDLIFYQGAGKTFPFGNTYSPRVFNGQINYVVTPAVVGSLASPGDQATPGPTFSLSPSGEPSLSPSGEPSAGPTLSISPSAEPSSDPTLSLAPSSKPSNAPSLTPSGEPSYQPSAMPSDAPTPGPTSSCSECKECDQSSCDSNTVVTCQWDSKKSQCKKLKGRRIRGRVLHRDD